MHLEYNEVLSKEERTMYTQRLLKLHEIIADAPPEQYNHSVYTKQNGWFKRLRTGCGTAACAVGHAFLHADQFPGLNVNDHRTIAPTLVRTGQLQPIGPADSGFYTYFGPDSYRAIFHLGAYDKPDSEVTKYDALNRIEEYIGTVLGCKLVEITS